MSTFEHHNILQEIADLFEALGTKIEHAIEAFPGDESGTVDLAALHRAKDATRRGTEIARNAASETEPRLTNVRNGWAS